MLPFRRIGYLGIKAKRFSERNTNLYGQDWGIGFIVNNQLISRDEALKYYEESYRSHLEKNPQLLEYIINHAADVYDTDPSNIESGLNWHHQEGSQTHLQDIAVRRVLAGLKLKFKGQRLLQIREKDSELAQSRQN